MTHDNVKSSFALMNLSQYMLMVNLSI